MNNEILLESAELVRQQLGSDLDAITLERAVFGLFFSGIKLSSGHGGLSFTPVKELPQAVCCPSSARAMPLSGRLAGRTANDLLNDLDNENVLRKALAVAALNALSSACLEKYPLPDDYEIIDDADAFDLVTIPTAGKTLVVGALIPMLKKLTAQDADYVVLEQDIRTLKGKELEHFAPAEDALFHVPLADLLVITGTTVLNGTLPGLLELARPDAQILVTGPTASMLPYAFFKRGVTMTGGIVVTDPDALLDVISEAGSGYHFFGKSARRTVVRKKT